MFNYKQYKKIYLAGIGGIGVSAIARLFKSNEVEVVGSELSLSPITDDLEKVGIKINSKQLAKNINASFDLFIYTPALPSDHPEKLAAQQLNIPSYSYPEFLGLLSSSYKTIAISGTHGKSTTTAMTGLIFSQADLDPTVIVGSQVNKFDHNLKVGNSELLIVEACEYRGHMLTINPAYICLTNIEEDHLDYYKNLADITDHFDRFLAKVEPYRAALNIDNSELDKLASKYNVLTFGILNPKAKVRATNIKVKNKKQSFDLFINNKLIINIELKIPGTINIYNALAAISLANFFAIEPRHIKKALVEYQGAWRRFEILGALSGVHDTIVISDYAHHPTAVKETIAAAKEFYSTSRIIAVFQPHHHNRVKRLFNDFAKSFASADYSIISEIYDVKGREDQADQIISSADLVKSINQSNIVYSANLIDTADKIKKIAKPNDIILIMGAGDIDSMARQLINN